MTFCGKRAATERTSKPSATCPCVQRSLLRRGRVLRKESFIAGTKISQPAKASCDIGCGHCPLPNIDLLDAKLAARKMWPRKGGNDRRECPLRKRGAMSTAKSIATWYERR